MMRRWVLVAALAACGDGNKTAPDARLEGFDKPDIVCPGDPKCATTGDGQLKVGVAKRIWTPMSSVPGQPPNFETYTDENNDRQWQKTEPYTDLNGNGKFDGVWLFGGG